MTDIINVSEKTAKHSVMPMINTYSHVIYSALTMSNMTACKCKNRFS